MSRATIRSTVPRWRAGSSSAPGSSKRVTPAQVATGASSGSPTGAVASTASATARERNGPISASASGSPAASSAARMSHHIGVRHVLDARQRRADGRRQRLGEDGVDAHYSV